MNTITDFEIEKMRREIYQKLYQKERIELNKDGNTYSHILDDTKFPELVLLNQSSNKRPIFWFHSVGGVQPYFRLADITPRPFYGIEARGLRTNRAPLYGVQALAAYYIHIITSIQAVGPYDFGGYSLGGLIAYEVTRQLQELGETVNSIVMIDTLDSSVSDATRNISYKSRLLQGVNHTLAANVIQNPERTQSLLINRNEVDWSMDEDNTLEQLTSLAIERVAFQSHNEMKSKILKMAELQSAYEYERYSIRPLIRPNEVECYFFRNKNGVLFGDLSPYFWVIEDESQVDNFVYWELWQENLPKFQMIDIDSSTHMMMLTEKIAYEPILEFCQQLYST